MTFRPGQAKGPSVGKVSGGSSSGVGLEYLYNVSSAKTYYIPGNNLTSQARMFELGINGNLEGIAGGSFNVDIELLGANGTIVSIPVLFADNIGAFDNRVFISTLPRQGFPDQIVLFITKSSQMQTFSRVAIVAQQIPSIGSSFSFSVRFTNSAFIATRLHGGKFSVVDMTVLPI